MEDKFKKVLTETSEIIDKLEDKIEDFTDDFSEDTSELWADVKRNLTEVSGKLKTASKDLEGKSDEAQLQAHLGTMEAHDRFSGIKDTVDKFTQEVSAKTKTGLDTVELKAHLVKMEAKDYWQENGDTITQEFKESSEKVKGLTLEAASEIKDYFVKLTNTLSKK